MTKFLDILSGGTATVSIASIVSNAQTILGIIAALVSITTGLISIVLKIRNAAADGEITREERDEIDGDVDDLAQKIKEIKKND